MLVINLPEAHQIIARQGTDHEKATMGTVMVLRRPTRTLVIKAPMMMVIIDARVVRQTTGIRRTTTLEIEVQAMSALTMARITGTMRAETTMIETSMVKPVTEEMTPHRGRTMTAPTALETTGRIIATNLRTIHK